MAIEKPQLVQARTGGFAADIMSPTTQTRHGSAVNHSKEFGKLFTNFTENILKPARERAAVEGYQDAMVGMTEKRSWLTNDEYQKGVKFAAYQTKASGMSAKLSEIGKDSALKGESLEQYNERIKQAMSPLTEEFGGLQLEGKLREIGMRELMDIPAKQLQQYQKQREEITAANVYKVQNVTASDAMVKAMATGDYNGILMGFDKHVELGGGTVEAMSDASKRYANNISTVLNGVNVGNEADRAQVAQIQSFLHSKEARDRFDPAELASLQSKISSLHDKSMNVLQAQLGNEERIVKLAAANGQYMTVEQFNERAAYYDDLVTKGLLDPQSAEALKDGLFPTVEQGVRNQHSDNNILVMDKLDRQMSGTDDKPQANAMLKQNVKQYGDSAQAYAATIENGIKYQNPEARKLGAMMMATGFGDVLNLPIEKMNSENVNGTQQESFKAFMGMLQQYKGVSPDYFNDVSSVIPDPDVRDAMKALAASGNPVMFNSMQGMQEVKRLADRLKKARDSGTSGEFTKDEREYTAGNMDAYIRMWKNSAGSAKYFNNASDSVQAVKANDLNAHFKENTPAIIAGTKGGSLVMVDQKTSAMIQTNYALHTKRGLIAMTPNFYNGVSYKVGGKDYPLSKEQFGTVVDILGDDFHKQVAKGYGSKDDIHVTTEGNFLVVSQLDSDGNVVYTRNYTTKQISERANAAFKDIVSSKPQEAFTTISASGKRMILTNAVVKPFGSATMAQRIMQNLVMVEGIVHGEQDTRSKQQIAKSKMKDVPSTGVGVSLNHHPEWRAKFRAAGNDPVKQGAVQSEFFAKYYTVDFNMKEAVKAVGLPPMDSPNAVRLLPQYLAMADIAYYAPAAGHQYKRLLVMARDGGDKGYKKAMAALAKIPQYKQSQKLRQKGFEAGLLSAFNQGKILAAYKQRKSQEG